VRASLEPIARGAEGGRRKSAQDGSGGSDIDIDSGSGSRHRPIPRASAQRKHQKQHTSDDAVPAANELSDEATMLRYQTPLGKSELPGLIEIGKLPAAYDYFRAVSLPQLDPPNSS
jgi:hypothetical protein